MQEWLKVSLMLCVFGFLRELRPSEPFVFEFMSGEWRNITAEQISREIYPLGIYFYLGLLVIVFLVTDMLRYKPVILASVGAGIALWALLIWTYTIEWLYVTQFFFGAYMAAEVAYYTYIYAKVDRDRYQQVTGHARSAILTGRFSAGLLAQLLVSFDVMDIRELNYISFGTQCTSLIVAILLPPVKTSLYFYSTAKKIDGKERSTVNQDRTVTTARDEVHDKPKKISYINYLFEMETEAETANENRICQQQITTPVRPDNEGVKQRKETMGDAHIRNGVEESDMTVEFSCNGAFRLLWEHFVAAYSNKIVLQWSFWWSLAMCGFLQVQTYIQPLWQQIDPDLENFYNGAVEAALTLLGALGALLAGSLNSKKIEKFDLLFLIVCSAIEGALLIVAAFTETVFVAYATYITFGALYHFMITIASYTVAKYLIEDSFALIFGINTLIALVFQTIMTIVVVSETGLSLTARQQFIVYGSYFLILSIIFCAAALIKLTVREFRRKTLAIE